MVSFQSCKMGHGKRSKQNKQRAGEPGSTSLGVTSRLGCLPESPLELKFHIPQQQPRVHTVMAPGTSSTCCGCTIGSTTKTSSARVPQQRPGCNPKSHAIFRHPDGTKIPKRQFETHAAVSIPSSAREGRIVEKGCCGSIYVSLGFTFPRRIGAWFVSAVKFRAPGCGFRRGRQLPAT